MAKLSSKVLVRAGRRKSSLLKSNDANDFKDFKEKMSLLQVEGGAVGGDEDDNDDQSFSESDEEEFFRSLRNGDLNNVKRMVSMHPSLVDVEFGVVDGEEGSEYAYSGKFEDGFCGPFHVAAEAGQEAAILFLNEKHPEGDAFMVEDYKGRLPEEVAKGGAVKTLRDLVQAMKSGEKGGGRQGDFSAQDEEDFFYALRAGVMDTVTSLVEKYPEIMHVQFGVWEGSDTRGMMPQVKSRRIYTYCGNLSEGQCGPFHVAAEAGHKNLLLYLAKQDDGGWEEKDFLDRTAEEVAEAAQTQGTLDAFKELRGQTLGAMEVFEGEHDESGRRKVGKLLKKMEGYDEELIIHYEGRWKGGKYDGKGVLYWEGIMNGTDESGKPKPIRMYDGEFKAGKKDGKGVLFADPRIEREGLRFGKKKMEEKVFLGSFKEDKKHGHGIEWDNGDKVFEGNFRDGVKNGYGVYTPAAGNRYEGNFLDGKKQGAGTYTFDDGSKYEGMFDEDQMHGHGTVYVHGKEPKNFEYKWGKKQKELGREERFFADPSDLFGERNTGDCEGEEGEGKGVDEVLFDRDGGLDAHIVKLAIVFLDGLNRVLERKRMGSGGDSEGDWVYEQIKSIVESARTEVIARCKQVDLCKKRFRKGFASEMELKAFARNAGAASMKMIQDIVEFGENEGTGKGRSISKRLEIMLLGAKANTPR